MARRIRAAATALLAVALVGVAIVAGAKGGFPATRPKLLSGAAWLASVQVGQLTLLDGSSAEVAAQVPVAGPGERVEVVQQAANGYAINRSTGTIRRVDGATFTVTDPASPLTSAGDGLRAYAGPDILYALDVNRGLLMNTDPVTLAARGNAVPLGAAVNGQTAALDTAGRLWVLDIATGDLVWLDHGKRHLRSGVVGPGVGSLVLAGDRPVVVDTRRGTATVLDADTGAPLGRVDLSLRPDDKPQVSGAPHAGRLYVVAARGILEICPLAATACTSAIPLGTGGDLGAPVETAGRLFVPDYSAGRVWIVDLGSAKVVAQPQILAPKTKFQLLTRDGVVFFNDPDSAKAGVIRLDGGVRTIAKYDTSPGGSPSPSAPDTSQSPATTNPAPPSTPAAKPTPTRPPATVQISVSPPSPLVGETVVVQAVVHGGTAPTSVRWDLGDGATATGTYTTHSWSAARTYQVSVRATFPGGQSALASRSVKVSTPPVLHVQPPAHGRVTGPGIDCPPACTATFKLNDPAPLTAVPDSGYAVDKWGGACGGSQTTCTVRMTGAKTVTVAFAVPPTLTVEEPNAGSVTGPGIDCPPKCTATYQPNQKITLTAVPDGDDFLFWGGACSGSQTTCRLTMTGDKDVTATFGFIDKCPPVCSLTNDFPKRSAQLVQPVGPGPEPGHVLAAEVPARRPRGVPAAQHHRYAFELVEERLATVPG